MCNLLERSIIHWHKRPRNIEAKTQASEHPTSLSPVFLVTCRQQLLMPCAANEDIIATQIGKLPKLYMQFNPCDKQKYTTLAKHIKRFKRMWLSNVSDFRKICSIQRCTEGFTVCHVITWLSSFISEHDWQQIQIENNENLQSKKTSGTSLWYNFTSNECIVHSSNHDYQNTQLKSNG